MNNVPNKKQKKPAKESFINDFEDEFFWENEDEPIINSFKSNTDQMPISQFNSLHNNNSNTLVNNNFNNNIHNNNNNNNINNNNNNNYVIMQNNFNPNYQMDPNVNNIIEKVQFISNEVPQMMDFNNNPEIDEKPRRKRKMELEEKFNPNGKLDNERYNEMLKEKQFLQYKEIDPKFDINEDEEEIKKQYIVLEEIRFEINRIKQTIAKNYNQYYVKKEQLMFDTNIFAAINLITQRMNGEIGKINGRVDKVLLSPSACYHYEKLKFTYENNLALIKIYEHEIVSLSKGIMPDPKQIVSFLFNRQPLTKSIKHKTRQTSSLHQCVVTAKILLGVSCKFQPYQNQTLDVSLTILEGKKVKGNVVKTLSTETSFDSNLATVKFIFRSGTNVEPAQIQFSIKGKLILVDGTPIDVSLNTWNPIPIIITTNENQWEKAEGKLIRRALFGDIEKPETSKKKVTWYRVMNQIQFFYMRATRQDEKVMEDVIETEAIDPNSPQCLPKINFTRSLTNSDFQFFYHEKCNTQDHMFLTDFQMFWEWFGGTCHHYRHNKSIRNLYLQGLIFGFISKETCNSLLTGQRHGSFIIRNSQASNDGSFTIAFLNNQGLIRHSKIEPKKVAPPYSSLPDYLRDKNQLHFVIRPPYCTQNAVINYYTVQDKNSAFSKYWNPVKESADDYYIL
eukprot:TRINITY_DN6703_c0_g1_i1.p1 TRINITY_DN6703_c0_g1~~TRINITY_DN6703_c0_g1_i1.p1  ORF type:complete len:676 (-),score=161.22 TRINITY_DN6703_c0_g1_i1:31-2058(-)